MESNLVGRDAVFIELAKVTALLEQLSHTMTLQVSKGEARDTRLGHIETELAVMKSKLSTMEDDARWLRRGVIGQLIAVAGALLIYGVTHLSK